MTAFSCATKEQLLRAKRERAPAEKESVFTKEKEANEKNAARI